MNKIDVSVVVVSYNQEMYIKKAIESVLMQKVDFNYEIIFADDCSSDNTTKIILDTTKKCKNVTYLFSKKNHGNTYNSINAYKRCCGKYIVALEGDDYWISENKLQMQYDFLEKNKNYIAVSNKRVTLNKSGKKLASYPLGIDIDIDISLKDFLHGKTFNGIETMFRNVFKSKEIDKDFINIILSDRMIIDLPLCVFLLQKGRVRIIAKDFSVYRTSSLGNNNNYNSKLDFYVIAKNHINILNRLQKYYNFDFSYMYAQRLLEAKVGLLTNRNYKKYKDVVKLIPKNNRFLNIKMISFFPLFFRNFINKIRTVK